MVVQCWPKWVQFLLTGAVQSDQMSPGFNENGSIQEEYAECALRMFITGWSNCAT